MFNLLFLLDGKVTSTKDDGNQEVDQGVARKREFQNDTLALNTRRDINESRSLRDHHALVNLAVIMKAVKGNGEKSKLLTKNARIGHDLLLCQNHFST